MTSHKTYCDVRRAYLNRKPVVYITKKKPSLKLLEQDIETGFSANIIGYITLPSSVSHILPLEYPFNA